MRYAYSTFGKRSWAQKNIQILYRILIFYIIFIKGEVFEESRGELRERERGGGGFYWLSLVILLFIKIYRNMYRNKEDLVPDSQLYYR